MKHVLPSRMMAVFQDEDDGKLIVKEVDVPAPGKGEVLIKVGASPINPTDLAKIREYDPDKDGIFSPGTEGSGIVVAAGKGLLPSIFKGKRVAFAAKYPYSGAWAEYVLTAAGSCFPISKRVSDEQASMALVNPMTALAFLDYARKYSPKAVVFTAANSALVRIARSLMEPRKIKVLNVVRNETSFRELREMGVRHIMNSGTEGFPDKLADWCKNHEARLIYDAVGGAFINSIMDTLPENSSLLLYGNLSNTRVEFLPPQLLRKHSRITGFFLGSWIEQQGMLQTIIKLRKVNKMLKQGMETKIQARFPLASIQEAVKSYEENMGTGKVILKPEL